MSEYIHDKKYKDQDFTKKHLAIAEYENCTFKNCNFSKSELSKISFEDCNFESCDFSNAEIQQTAFRECLFEVCKMIGLRFEDINPFLFAGTFDGCDLSYASFYKVDLTSTLFRGCDFTEVDFTEAKLNSVEVRNCNFQKATFQNTKLRNVDFRNAFNFNIDPAQNEITGARFSSSNVKGLLSKYDIEID